jgi:hypothetical protein
VTDWASLRSCQDLTDAQISEVIESRDDVRVLLEHLAIVARPGQGGPRVLLLFARLATPECDWLEGALQVVLKGDGQGTAIESYAEIGAGLRERVVPRVVLPVPVDEFLDVIARFPHLIAPLAVFEASGSHAVLGAHEAEHRVADSVLPDDDEAELAARASNASVVSPMPLTAGDLPAVRVARQPIPRAPKVPLPVVMPASATLAAAAPAPVPTAPAFPSRAAAPFPAPTAAPFPSPAASPFPAPASAAPPPAVTRPSLELDEPAPATFPFAAPSPQDTRSFPLATPSPFSSPFGAVPLPTSRTSASASASAPEPEDSLPSHRIPPPPPKKPLAVAIARIAKGPAKRPQAVEDEKRAPAARRHSGAEPSESPPPRRANAPLARPPAARVDTRVDDPPAPAKPRDSEDVDKVDKGWE